MSVTRPVHVSYMPLADVAEQPEDVVAHLLPPCEYQRHGRYMSVTCRVQISLNGRQIWRRGAVLVTCQLRDRYKQECII